MDARVQAGMPAGDGVMKVLLLHYNVGQYAQGGAERIFNDSATALRMRGHDVLATDGREWIDVDRPAPEYDVAIVFTMHPRDYDLNLTKWIVSGKPYIIWTQDYWPFCPHRMCLIGDESCPAVTGTCNNACGAFVDGKYSRNHMEPWSEACRTFAQASKVMVGNYRSAKMLQRNGIAVWRTMAYAVDADLFSPDWSQHHVCNPVIAVSSAWPQYKTKGLHILAEAFSGRNWGCQLITGLPKEDVAKALKGVDIFVFPSCYEETWGLCLTEAMASGCACVSSDVAGARAQITHAIDGVIVPKRDPVALREAVESLIDDPCRREALGRSARLKVERKFTLEKLGKRLEDALLDCINDCGAQYSITPEEVLDAKQEQSAGKMAIHQECEECART